jgi:dolichol-phosphate mannosyltransferase
MGDMDGRLGTIVLTTYNEAQAIGKVMDEIADVVPELESRGLSIDVLLVDDSSPDGTAAVAQEAALRRSLSLRVLSAPRQGLGQAYLRAFKFLAVEDRADVVITLDADGQHNPGDIPALLARFDEGFDVVVGSRWAKGGAAPGLSLHRKAASRLANVLFRSLSGTRTVRDATAAFRVTSLDVVRDFDPNGLAANGYSVQTSFVALSAANGYSIGEAPIVFRTRETGSSKLRLGDCTEFLRNLVALRALAAKRRHARLAPENRSFDARYFAAAPDQERLGDAKRFFNWILDEFEPWTQGNALEVGAGSGTVICALAARRSDLTLTALEPASNFLPVLEAAVAQLPVDVLQGTLADHRPEDRYDTLIYVSVLEHVENDIAELKLAYESLTPGGSIQIFVPAFEGLYSELDLRAGHYRRYRLAELRDMVDAAGFVVQKARYFDALGALAYYVVYRIGRRPRVTVGSVAAYDRLVVPVSRLVDRLLVRPPFGKNIVLVATKPTEESSVRN